MFTRKIDRSWKFGIALCLASAPFAANADTLPFVPNFTVGSTALTGSQVTENTDGSFRLTGTQQGGNFNGGAVWSFAWDLTVNQDPMIAGSLSLTNLTNTTRSFSVSLMLPVTPAFSPSLFGGSLSATLVDLNGDLSASLAPSSASASIYRGAIDGVTVLSLFAANLTCTGSSAGCSASGSDDFGLPGPTLAGPGVTNSIATLLNFTLSPGDRVTFNSNFTVEPPAAVPLPAALPLLVMSLGGLAAARRRKSRAANATESQALC